jgi:hypothetical protein
MGYPAPGHTLTMTTAGIAHVELASHAGPSTPTSDSMALSRPRSGL